MKPQESSEVANSHIDSRPNKCGGKPCIAGTRIRVQDIYVWHEVQKKSVDEIVNEFRELSLASVHAALAYFWDNQEEIRKDLREDESFLKQLRSATGPGPLEKRRQQSKEATSDSVSS